MSTDVTPPMWAESILRAVLKRTDFDSVSGDLLEEYRESVYPASGRDAADRWYLVQVFGFAMRSVGVWGGLFGTAFVARTALDWFVPTQDFSVRSSISTDVGVGLLLFTGFWFAWRSGSMASGTLTATLAAIIGALISIVGVAGMLAVFHDQQTLAAIDGSGGLGEVFTLPIMMVIPALILGTLGGALGAAANAKLRIDPV
jgi:hypothetical protein